MDSAALASAAHAVDETQLLEQQQLAEQELAEVQEDEALLAEEDAMAAAQDVSTFVHPPERHISVDPRELKLAIKNRLELGDRSQFEDLTKLMEGVANFDFFDLKQRMRNNFLPFSCGARNSIFLQRSSKAMPTTMTLDEKEDEFIADVYEVLAASHYTLLTKEEWDLATSENFNLNLPMKVNWEYMEKDLLTKFWSSSPQRTAMRDRLPGCMADRILVFHRGIGVERLTGLLIDQKLDLLMDYTVFHILKLITRPFTKKAPPTVAQQLAASQARARAARKQAIASGLPNFHIVDSLPDRMKKALDIIIAPLSGNSSRAVSPLGATSPQAAGTSRVVSGSTTQQASRAVSPPHTDVPEGSAMSSYEFEDGAMIASRHRFAKRVERQTLARQCPTLLMLLKSFPQSMSLQEPTFKDLVVVYRRSLPKRKPPTAAANAPNKNKDERLQGILQYRNINIKIFGETPMADVEIIFPDKVVGVKPFQLVNLMVTVITALVAGALVLWKASDINMNILWTAASLVLTRCFAVYTQAQTQRTMLQQQMTSSLYDKMQDSQEGVISVITEELSDQQLKQMLLAYMVLIIKGRAMLPQDLDDACEDFLMKEFEHPIDYDLDAALPRLKTWGLVRENNQGKLEALSMGAAISVLEQAWSVAYKEVGKEGDDKVPTIDMITGAYSVFHEGMERKQNEMRAQAQAAATAEAARKGGIMGKAKNVFSTKSASTAGAASPNGLDSVYPSSAAYGSAGGAVHGPPSDLAAADESDRGSTGGGSYAGAPERKKSSSLRGMFKKLKA